MRLSATLRQFRRAAGVLVGLALGGLRVLRAYRLRNLDVSRERDERFRLHADNARDLIYRVRFHPTPGFEYVSPSSTAMTGYTPEEHYADPELGFKRVHPEDRRLLENSMHTAITRRFSTR